MNNITCRHRHLLDSHNSSQLGVEMDGASINLLLHRQVEVVRICTKSQKWWGSFDHQTHSQLPLPFFCHGTWIHPLSAPPQSVERGRLPKKSRPGNVSRQRIPANPTDLPFHSQENNAVPKRGKSHTVDLGTDRWVSLFPLKAKEQRCLKRLLHQTQKLVPSETLTFLSCFQELLYFPVLRSQLVTQQRAANAARYWTWNEVFLILLYLDRGKLALENGIFNLT